jgi:selenocysteine lyase/cysteine desulfurase
MRSFQDRAEGRPDKFIRYDYPRIVDESRAAMSKLLNVDVDTLSFVPNATTGVNTILRNLVFKPREKIVYFATIYGACEKTVEYVVETTPAEAIKIQYTYPVEDDWLVDEFRKVVRQEQDTGNTVKVAIFDTIVSLPGLRMPFEQLTAACKELGVLSCVDGAHGVGHIALDLGKLDCDFFVSNCHKYDTDLAWVALQLTSMLGGCLFLEAVQSSTFPYAINISFAQPYQHPMVLSHDPGKHYFSLRRSGC